MEKKKEISKVSNKTTRKPTSKKKKKGFTLLEFIIVIIFLGGLITFGVIYGINYYENESKRSYIDLAKDIISAARKNVNLGGFEMFESDTTFYIESSCIKSKNLPQTTYGKLKKAYVVVTYNGNFSYYWTSVSESGYGIKKIIRFDLLSNDDIESGITEEDITTSRGIDGRTKIVVVDQQGGCNQKKESTAIVQIDGNTENVMALDNLSDKIEAFNLKAVEIDGHDFNQIYDAIQAAKESDIPVVIIANTIKGKGVSFMENNPGWHGTAPKKDEYEKAMQELNNL